MNIVENGMIPETYRWFMDHYELKETLPFYGEKFLYYIKK